ncbi:4-hydroxy-3-methylbut-2-enyl diphosphate reductase [Oceanispirochaeta sp.]|jgi:4-hydroxy-3-methylbut-2-enyl diphosphate reductase|uniref:4-hydroxy-3-methylbut-2-enyl diphosphate reductase n=1 Tax=Oceanispirochaeta sp. TaxID=2035350 RepID=UPI0026079B39|nr:4-hydroxy-3-methylbut-2-enyl diphosphate reductase [Oceanispirochaeta sp.]MDA3956840.1 4-hydroxy-3-methylbut-2-enyl diphosphate reductase [Oceanispirochaeta sp.]
MKKNKKTIIRADEMGFCLGVRRAVGTLEEAVNFEDSEVYTLGPIIHNPRVINDFAVRGVKTVESPEDVPSDCRVIIRAHGIPPQTREALNRRGSLVMDGTCPKVIASQKTVRKYSSLGYHTVIVGDPDHGEIKGLAGFADNPIVISDPEEAGNLSLKGPVMVISQTTIKQDEYDRVCHVLKEKCADLKIVESICSATSKRQEALKELCTRVDACLIIGGKDSANTQRLYKTAQDTGIPCWYIQDASEIPQEAAGYDIIGLSAGASTPDSLIGEVEERLRSM